MVMSLTLRPLKVRIGFRDLWDYPNAPAPEATKALSELLGFMVEVGIDRAILWKDLHNYFKDSGVFAPNIAGIVQAWAERLHGRLQDDSNAAWTEKLLEAVISPSSVMTVRLEVSLFLRIRIIDRLS